MIVIYGFENNGVELIYCQNKFLGIGPERSRASSKFDFYWDVDGVNEVLNILERYTFNEIDIKSGLQGGLENIVKIEVPDHLIKGFMKMKARPYNIATDKFEELLSYCRDKYQNDEFSFDSGIPDHFEYGLEDHPYKENYPKEDPFTEEDEKDDWYLKGKTPDFLDENHDFDR